MEELARQIQTYVDAYSDPESVVSILDRDGLWNRLFGCMLPVKSRISRKPNLLNDISADVSGGMQVVLALVLDVVKLTRATVEAVGKERTPVAGASRHRQNDVSLAATLGPSGGVAAGPMNSGGLGVALLCASAKRFLLVPEVF